MPSILGIITSSKRSAMAPVANCFQSGRPVSSGADLEACRLQFGDEQTSNIFLIVYYGDARPSRLHPLIVERGAEMTLGASSGP